MWRRKCVLLLNQSLKTTVVGHGFRLPNPIVVPPPSPSHPSRLLGSRTFGNQECGVATRSLYFPAFLSVGFVKRFSSSSSSLSSSSLFVSPSPSDSKPKSDGGEEASPIGQVEARRLMRLVNVKALKTRLGAEEKEVISYGELLEACKGIDIARSSEEAAAFARILDEAGVVFLYRDKVYLHPDEIADRIRKADPLALTPEEDQEELKWLQEKKEEIDVLAHRQVRHILWIGLVLAMLQIGLFFRLTFWEFSWDVMEPIAFFTTTTGLIISYAYFVMTFRDPTYADLMKRLFLIRQRKLFKKYSFDCARFKELQKKCKIRHDATASIKNRVGLEVELEDALHKD